jgi:hypothetical protein
VESGFELDEKEKKKQKPAYAHVFPSSSHLSSLVVDD